MSPRRYLLVWIEVRTDAQRIVNGMNTGKRGEAAQIINVAGACSERLHREDVFRRRDHDPQIRVVEYAPLAGILLARDVNASLLVQPPRRQPQLLSDGARLFDDDPVRDKHGVYIPSDAGRVIGQCHRGAAWNG